MIFVLARICNTPLQVDAHRATDERVPDLLQKLSNWIKL